MLLGSERKDGLLIRRKILTVATQKDFLRSSIAREKEGAEDIKLSLFTNLFF